MKKERDREKEEECLQAKHVSPDLYLPAGIPVWPVAVTACALAGEELCQAGCPSRWLRTGLRVTEEGERER